MSDLQDSIAAADRWMVASGIPRSDEGVAAWLAYLGVPVPVGIRPLMAAIRTAVIAAGDEAYAQGRTDEANDEPLPSWTRWTTARAVPVSDTPPTRDGLTESNDDRDGIEPDTPPGYWWTHGTGCEPTLGIETGPLFPCAGCGGSDLPWRRRWPAGQSNVEHKPAQDPSGRSPYDRT